MIMVLMKHVYNVMVSVYLVMAIKWENACNVNQIDIF